MRWGWNRNAGLLPRALNTAPTLRAEADFRTNTAFGDAYWLVGGRSLMLSSGYRVLHDVKEELDVRGDLAWTPAIVTALRDRIRDARPASGPSESAWDREYVSLLQPVRIDDPLTAHLLRCALWLTYSRSEWSQGPRVVQFPRETGVPRFGQIFSSDSPPSVETPTSIVDRFDPEELAFNPFSGAPGAFTGGGTVTSSDRRTSSSSGNTPLLVLGALVLAMAASGGGKGSSE